MKKPYNFSKLVFYHTAGIEEMQGDLVEDCLKIETKFLTKRSRFDRVREGYGVPSFRDFRGFQRREAGKIMRHILFLFGFGILLTSAGWGYQTVSKSDEPASMIEVKVAGVILAPPTNTPVVLLVDLAEKMALPIWVGVFEANAIALEMEHISPPRPMTHDLLKNIIQSFQAKVEKVVIHELKNNTFFAAIFITQNSSTLNIDSRPSDAIALALRIKAPIYVLKGILAKANTLELKDGKIDQESESWKRFLNLLEPKQDKYSM